MKKITLIVIVLTFITSGAFSAKLDEPAPTFALRDNADCNFFLSDYIGPRKKKPCKGLILTFFASYCKPCKHELPILNSLVDDFEKKGIKIVIVAFKEDFDNVSDLLSELKIDKPIILADKYGKVGDKYRVRFLPMTFFINSDGTIKDIIQGELPDIEKVFRDKAEKLVRPPVVAGS